eukprot:s279_g36.t4
MWNLHIRTLTSNALDDIGLVIDECAGRWEHFFERQYPAEMFVALFRERVCSSEFSSFLWSLHAADQAGNTNAASHAALTGVADKPAAAAAPKTPRRCHRSSTVIPVLDSPDLLGFRTSLEIEDSPANACAKACSPVMRRWGAGTLKPPAGSIVDMPVPNVATSELRHFHGRLLAFKRLSNLSMDEILAVQIAQRMAKINIQMKFSPRRRQVRASLRCHTFPHCTNRRNGLRILGLHELLLLLPLGDRIFLNLWQPGLLRLHLLVLRELLLLLPLGDRIFLNLRQPGMRKEYESLRNAFSRGCRAVEASRGTSAQTCGVLVALPELDPIDEHSERLALANRRAGRREGREGTPGDNVTFGQPNSTQIFGSQRRVLMELRKELAETYEVLALRSLSESERQLVLARRAKDLQAAKGMERKGESPFCFFWGVEGVKVDASTPPRKPVLTLNQWAMATDLAIAAANLRSPRPVGQHGVRIFRVPRWPRQLSRGKWNFASAGAATFAASAVAGLRVRPRGKASQGGRSCAGRVARAFGGQLEEEVAAAAEVVQKALALVQALACDMDVAPPSLGKEIEACNVTAGISAIKPGDSTPVTAADFAIQGLVSRALKKRFPLDRFMGEEDSKELREDEDLCNLALAKHFAGRSAALAIEWKLLGACGTAFTGLPIAEQAMISMQMGGIPVNPDAQLRDRQRPEPVRSKPRQLTAEESTRLEEARGGRAAAEAANRQHKDDLAKERAQEEARLAEGIARQNAVRRRRWLCTTGS